MVHHTARHHRCSVRLKGYDYSQAGMYFVTICAEGRACLFGEIADGRMRVNDAGRMVQAAWDDLPKHYPNVELDECVVMPNHVHGIIVIVGARSPRPNTHAGAGTAPLRVTLGRMVAYFKYQSAKHINEMRRMPGFPVWQRNYYEHIIRDDESVNRIREYITNNPLQWEIDRENPSTVNAGAKISPLPKNEPWRI